MVRELLARETGMSIGVVAFSEGLVDMLERNAKKGRTVALSGRMTYRKWRKDGEQTDRTQAEIVLDRNAEIEFHSPLAE